MIFSFQTNGFSFFHPLTLNFLNRHIHPVLPNLNGIGLQPVPLPTHIAPIRHIKPIPMQRTNQIAPCIQVPLRHPGPRMRTSLRTCMNLIPRFYHANLLPTCLPLPNRIRAILRKDLRQGFRYLQIFHAGK